MKYSSKLSLAASTILIMLSAGQTALAEVSGNFGATTNYVWRGVSQSSDSASVSGGIDYTSESGFYAGTYVGSLGDSGSGFNGAETDFYIGVGGQKEDFTYDIGYVYYVYTELEDSDFGEVYVNAGFGNLGAGVAYTVNSQVDKGAGFESGDIYTYISYGGIDLSNEFTLAFTLGLYTFDSDGSENDYNYAHAQADIAKGDFTFSLVKAQESAFSDEDFKIVASWSTSFLGHYCYC